jgi:hypothetical protein
MSVYQTSILAFIQVLQSQANVISIQDWQELHQLSNDLPANDDEEISLILENWLKSASRSQLLEAYKQNLKLLVATSNIDLEVNIGIANSKSPTPVNQPSESSKELLDNAIKNNSPLSDKQKSSKS